MLIKVLEKILGDEKGLDGLSGAGAKETSQRNAQNDGQNGQQQSTELGTNTPFM